MPKAIDILEKRVAAAVDRIASLRERAAALERELEATRAAAHAAAARPAAAVPDQPPVGELERLRAERLIVRERVRGLLKEIERVSW